MEIFLLYVLLIVISLLLATSKLISFFREVKRERKENPDVSYEAIAENVLLGRKPKKSVTELQEEKVFLLSRMKSFIGFFLFVFYFPVAMLRMALIARFGISITWKLPFQIYEIWSFVILAICYYYAYSGAIIFPITLASLIAIANISEIASNLEIRNSRLRIQEIPTHKLHISHLISEALIVVVGFACVYFCLSLLDPRAFNEQLSILDSIYYSFMIGTTVGFGDIQPVSGSARVLTIIEAFLGFIFIVFMVAVFVTVWLDKKGAGTEMKEDD
jgi:hypothetical protein